MLRFAIVTFLAVVAILFGLSLLPDTRMPVPSSSIKLANTRLTLYPQEDPEAVWLFSSADVAYNPDTRETTLNDIEDGQRTVDGKTDFTLQSEQVIISSDDNLRGEDITACLLDADMRLDMKSWRGEPVTINQREGKFYVPDLYYTGEDLLDNYAKRVSMRFDMSEFSVDCTDEACQNQFIDNGDASKSDYQSCKAAFENARLPATPVSN